MKSAAYWQARFKAIEAQANSIGAKSFSYVAAQYQQAEKELEQQIATWYVRLAKNNSVTMHDAQQLLSGKALNEFHWTVQEYIQYGEENALNGQWMQQLENASAKVHITKLEALKLQNQATIEKLFGKQYQSLYGAAEAVYEDSFYQSCYEVQKAFGIGWNIPAIDDNKLSAILSTPWAADGSSFSQRLWGNRLKLSNELQNTLTQGIMIGKKPDKMIAEMQKKMGTSKSNAGRLIMTESAAISSMAQEAAFNELGVEEFEVVETLDDGTCELCGSMDGKHFPMSDFQVGVTAPPFHPWCRGCTCPWFNDDFTADSERIARAADGTQYYIPGDTTYQQWKDGFVDGDPSSFDIAYNPKSGLASFKQHKEPEPEPPKKEYMTKKKLEGLIADTDTQIADLQKQFEFASGGFTLEEVIAQHGKLENFAQGKKLAVLQDLHDHLDQITAQKADWQEALDKKVLAAEKKKLKKESLLLQDQLDNFQFKTYSGIWKDDVTTADWLTKHGAIHSKKQYFENKLLYTTDPDEIAKWQDLIAQVEEFDAEGKSYYELNAKLSKVQSDLQMLKKGGKIDLQAEAFTQARKDAALWFDSQHGGFKAADAYFDPPAQQVYAAASKKEFDGFYTYTSGSGGHNRPLAGFRKPWSQPGSGWEPQFFVGPKQVWIDFEGKGEQIRGLTALIEKSTYGQDVWLQSGQDFATLEGVLGIPYGSLSHMTDADLTQLVGKETVIHQFISTAVNEGGGSMFNRKPMKLNIYAPKGSQMLYASDKGAFGKGENEMILQRGGTYKIIKAYWGPDYTDGGKTKIMVDMEIHPEAGYDLFQQDPTEWTGSTENYHS